MIFKKLNISKINMLCLALLCITPLACIQITQENRLQESIKTAQNSIQDILLQVNQKFTDYEKTNPQQGYCVTIQTTPTLQATVTPYGGSRTSSLLSGIPTDKAAYSNACPFCAYTKKDDKKSAILKDFHDGTYAVSSLSHQVLVIPHEHYEHLFTTPADMQATILKNILLIRSQYPDQIKRPIEFHCGCAAGQTVFHLHGRTGVYIK